METKNIAAIILAGGKGTRMNSDLAKVLHTILGKPIIYYILGKLQKLGIEDITVVVFHQAEPVKKVVSKEFQVKFGVQLGAFGTADALRAGLTQVKDEVKSIVVFNGDDSAFYSLETIQDFTHSHAETQAKVSMMTLNVPADRPLGRVIRDEHGNFEQILESPDYIASGLHSDEINCGAYVFDYQWLKENINKVQMSSKNEFYITDLLNIAKKENAVINIFALNSQLEWVGVNTQEELEYANRKMEDLLDSGGTK
jgi:bifunctional UDP-N-acetylglucosamine pyrophosphorylase / glucosamine-1-phosphate N-acetyltransferase